AAKAGVENSPIIVPSWYDMDPSSPFIKNLPKKKLPVPHYLFFSFKGDGGSENNDGSVTLESQLRPEMQNDAKYIFGLDETHTSILKSAVMSAKLNNILKEL
ncbi:MAG: hypothetical protein NE330_01895, partial [Lentisphaeraceae bacterium]|nr:hypothetical protein [Lentisphaeraceae bacterium]